MNFRASLFALGLTTAAFAPSVAEAKDCFILVHGHMGEDASSDVADLSQAATYGYKYWLGNGDFIATISRGGTANFGVVGWNASNASARSYSEYATVHDVITQINKITAGNGDRYIHAHQCTATDRKFVVAHSQGAQVMTYINGNAYSGAKFYNRATDSTTSISFSGAMSKITSVITIGGAINGTEGMDFVCNGGVDAAIAYALGRKCVPTLQTHSQYNPSTVTGTKMLKPVYHLGGTGSFSMPFTASSVLLSGEDDGTINLASQMNCKGSPTRDLESDFREYFGGLFTTFTCSNANKRHTNTFNVASINIHHNAERGYTSGTVGRDTSAADGMSCGNGKDMGGTIVDCITASKIK